MTQSVRQELRDGWIKICPYCQSQFNYTFFLNDYGPIPFFYSNNANELLLRNSDLEKVDKLHRYGAPTIDQLEALWHEIETTAPPAPSGGLFKLWANVRCPHCLTEFPYNSGVKDIRARLYDPKIIVVDGTIVVDDSGTYIVRVSDKAEEFKH